MKAWAVIFLAVALISLPFASAALSGGPTAGAARVLVAVFVFLFAATVLAKMVRDRF